jgi:hypothetical protein
MEHRGVNFAVMAEGSVWTWAVQVDGKTISGEELLRGVAVLRELKAIDREKRCVSAASAPFDSRNLAR